MYMKALQRLLLIDFDAEEEIVASLGQRNLELKVPTDNNHTTLHFFNCHLSDLYAEVEHYYGLSRRNKYAIERIIDNILKDYYGGKNEGARKAAGIQYAQKYPVPENVIPFVDSETVDLFYLEDR